MKHKIMGLLASLACLTGLFVAVSAPPASAAGCSTFLAKETTSYLNYGDGTWVVTPKVGYQICSTTTGDQYAKINQYFVVITKVSTSCGGGTIPTAGQSANGWYVNPDDLGAWNAAEKLKAGCSPGQINFSPGGVVVWQSSPAAYRCIGGSIIARTTAAWNAGPWDLPSLCVI